MNELRNPIRYEFWSTPAINRPRCAIFAIVDPDGICPAAGNAPGRRLAVASHDGGGFAELLGAAETVLAFAGCGAAALRGTTSLGGGPAEHAPSSISAANASRLTCTP
ncbi:hypothetical protein SK854_40745 [Lentzea sp. BCCO 10_0061]|uniref:Uncharacterized protein n=1 Tax=Lentzea sokolovensis TaxID=3095429 RepID=A0ABU4VAL1_9PSEU|nr:hypothetical protein [Lentzea sp. BCCO 10_0061]MDX8148500.1 hypothetical protein [Lentzea sp. BCCO 10_0061]